MTSPCELQLYCNDEHRARAIAKKIMIMAKELEKKYNFYNPNSYLSQLNQRKIDILDVQTKDLLTRAKLFYQKTNGIFDITMGTLTESRKLDSLEKIEEEINRIKPFLGVEHFKIKKNKLIFDNHHTLIDFGGFVKEFAVDQAVKILKKEKITSALVNFGGDIYALGLKPNRKKFSIGIKNPLKPSEYLTSVNLSNQALTTSASYERNYQVEETTFSHIISTQKPQTKVLSTTVLASTVLEAGAFSTALMVDYTLITNLQKLIILDSLKIIN